LREYQEGILEKRLVEIEDYIGDRKNIFFVNENKKISRWNYHEFYSELNIKRREA